MNDPLDNDPLDSVEGPEKTWQEFRVVFAAARLTCWLAADLDAIAPGFAEGIHSAFEKAMWEAEDRRVRHPDHDWVEFAVPGGTTLVTDVSDIEALREQLLPSTQEPKDVAAHARGLAWVGLHSALERFAKDSGVTSLGRAGWRRTGINSLPDQIGRFLEHRGQDLTETHLATLRTFDEVRHLVVHHRGTVSPRFLRNVPSSNLVIGEFFPITGKALWEAGDLAWATACQLHRFAS